MSVDAAATLVASCARELLAARDRAAQLATISGADPSFTMTAAYAVAFHR